jgi:hypothetical protein
MKYGMDAELIPIDSFLHTAHNMGLCRILESKTTPDNIDSELDVERVACTRAEDSDISRTIAIPTFDCISLLKISKKLQENAW